MHTHGYRRPLESISRNNSAYTLISKTFRKKLLSCILLTSGLLPLSDPSKATYAEGADAANAGSPQQAGAVGTGSSDIGTTELPLQTVQTAASSQGSEATGIAANHNLDLSSTIASVMATSLPTSGITISAGGAQQTFSNGSLLTPAQALAVSEILATGNQNLILNALGAAIGGSITIGEANLSALVIPQGVTATNYSNSGSLNIAGNLVAAGNLLLAPNNTALNTFSLTANNIFVSAGGLITNSIPTGNSLANLNLTALGNITNSGNILSTGNLNLSAGGFISNVTTAASSAAPSIAAIGNVNLTTGLGTVINQGIISSATGNVNVSTLLPGTDLNISSVVGSIIQAQLGSINISNAALSSTGNINLIDGDWLSKQLNIDAGCGTAILDIAQVLGEINIRAGAAHIMAETASLNIGTLAVTEDPFVSNNAGNLNLSATAFPATYLVGTAAGSIYTSASNTSIDTHSTTGAGGNVVLAAGVISTNTAGSISLARSGTGGDIYFTTGSTLDGNATQNIIGFDTSSSKSGSAGGNVTLIAMASSAGSTTGGHVFLPSTVQITTQGSGNASNGNVTIIGEAAETASNAISIGGVASAATTFGSLSNTGNVVIKSVTPNLSGVTISAATGAVTGSFDSSNYQGGRITTGSGGIFSPGSITLAGGQTTVNGTLSAATVTISTTAGSNGNITLAGNVIASSQANISADGTGAITMSEATVRTLSSLGTDIRGGSISLNGLFAYFTDTGTNTLFKINTATGAIVSSVTVGSNPQNIALSPDGSTIYTANNNSTTVSVVRSSDMTVTATITLTGTNPRPRMIAVAPDGLHAYVTTQGSNIDVQVLNLATNTVETIINGVGAPSGIAIDPMGSYVYVADAGNSRLLVIDTSTNAVVGSFTTMANSMYVTMSPSGDRIYISSASGNRLLVLDPITGQTVSSVSLAGAFGIATDPTGSQIYVGSISANQYYIVDAASNDVTTIAASTPTRGAGQFVGYLGNNVTAAIATTTGIAISQRPYIDTPLLTVQTASGNASLLSSGNTSFTPVSTSGSIGLGAKGNVTLAPATLTRNLYIGTHGSISTAGAVTANLVNLVSGLSNESIYLNNNISGVAGVSIFAGGSSSKILQTSGQISSSTGTLSLTAGQFGDNSSAIDVSVNSALNLRTPVIGNSISLKTTGSNASITLSKPIESLTFTNITATGAVTSAAITSGTSTTISAGGSVSTSNITSPSLSITTSSGSNGNIAINGNVTATSDVNLKADGTGTITVPDRIIQTLSPSTGSMRGGSLSPDGNYVYFTVSVRTAA